MEDDSRASPRRQSSLSGILEMAKAEWNGQIVAETDAYVTCEGNVYFPECAPQYSLSPASFVVWGDFGTPRDRAVPRACPFALALSATLMCKSGAQEGVRDALIDQDGVCLEGHSQLLQPRGRR